MKLFRSCLIIVLSCVLFAWGWSLVNSRQTVFFDTVCKDLPAYPQSSSIEIRAKAAVLSGSQGYSFALETNDGEFRELSNSVLKFDGNMADDSLLSALERGETVILTVDASAMTGNFYLLNVTSVRADDTAGTRFIIRQVLGGILVAAGFFGIAALIFLDMAKSSSRPSSDPPARQTSAGESSVPVIAAVTAMSMFAKSKQPKRHSGKCDGDCKNCPPHYGYRYGRWYYGHDHVSGCEFGGNKCSGSMD